ncbi:MAG: AAA family ATPase [Acidobacteriota bacterium]|nr:AAA family ATPase [Acidobacteriota bacterium]
MHITRVELENIKSHTAANYEFHRGTTAITGANGAGKTTIIEAIAWTLFDLLDYKKDDFLSRGAKKGSARVTFESHLDGRRYTVYRDTGTGYYVYDPELKTRIAEKKHEVSRFLQQHLGVEPGTDLETLFRSAIGVPQGTLTAIFLEPPSIRKTAFDKLLKVEEYREGAEKLLATVRYVERRLQDVRTKIAVAENELARLEETENAHRETQKKIGELEIVLKDLRAEIVIKTNTVAEFEKAETRVNETRSRRDRLEAQFQSSRTMQIRFQAERDQAAAALAAQMAIETDYQAHVKALEELNVLDARQIERNRIQNEANRAESFLNEAKSELKRFEENLAKAVESTRQIQDLQPKIELQNQLESERETLRTKRAEVEQAARQAARLEAEIQQRRANYKENLEKIKDAERGADAGKRVEQLETEKRAVETKLKDALEAETSLRLLVPQRAGLKNEIEKLQITLAENERQLKDFDAVSRLAREAIALNAKENDLVAEIAKMQAKIQHDEKFRGEVRNGLCPILSQRCLNIREGETLESYFQTELSSSYVRLETLEQEQKSVSRNLSAAREAERQLAKFESLQNQIENGRNDLQQRRATLEKVEREIAAFNGFKPETIEELKNRRGKIENEIASANEEARKYSELQGMKKGLEDVKQQGIALKVEQEKLQIVAAALPEIENRWTETENKLKELGNPRELAASYQRDAEQEPVWRGQIAAAKNNLIEKERSVQAFSEKLMMFAGLDADLAQTRRERDRTLSAYQTFLANQTIAATLPARENELAKAAEETERFEKEFQAVSAEYQTALENYNHEGHLNEKSALREAERREAATANEYAQEQRREADLRREIERLAAIRKQMQAEFAEKEKLERVFEATDFIRDTLKKAAPEVAKSYLFSISREANEIFREITGSAERSLRWTEDYEIVLEEMGHERPFINLSGGEQMAAALSVRLALLKQLSDVRVAFFDEPTTNLDRERRERLAHQIGQIRNFDQLFVISHDDTFEESVDYHIHVNGKQQSEVV